MRYGMINKLTIVNRNFLQTLDRNITHSAEIRRKATKNGKFEIWRKVESFQISLRKIAKKILFFCFPK